jgi:hypothetical protein
MIRDRRPPVDHRQRQDMNMVTHQAPPFVLAPCTTEISEWFVTSASTMMSISGACKVMDDDC